MVSTGDLGFLRDDWERSSGAVVTKCSELQVHIQNDESASFHLARMDNSNKFNWRVLTVIIN
jgi:hypothetical protein